MPNSVINSNVPASLPKLTSELALLWGQPLKKVCYGLNGFQLVLKVGVKFQFHSLSIFFKKIPLFSDDYTEKSDDPRMIAHTAHYLILRHKIG